MDVEVFKVSSLKDANNNVSDLTTREHGTLFIRQNPEMYNILNIEAPTKWNRPELEIEVDTDEDIYVISKIIEHFNALNKIYFDIDDIIGFLDDNPNLKKINSNIPRKWKSLRGE